MALGPAADNLAVSPDLELDIVAAQTHHCPLTLEIDIFN